MYKENNCFAHTRYNDSKKQYLTTHLSDTARMAAEFGEPFHGDDLAYAAGIFHDMGKAVEDFQDKLLGKPVHVDHSTAGAQEAESRFSPWGRLLAYIIAGHHGGLPDWESSSHSSLRTRLTKTLPQHNSSMYQQFLKLIEEEEIPSLNPPRFLSILQSQTFEHTKEVNFALMFLTRMIHSCLVDADFLDTERFMHHEQYDARHNTKSLGTLYSMFMQHMDRVRKGERTQLHIIRNQIFDSCITAAHKRPGFFSLTVPTGGGKTLASMGFALEHAKIYQKRRVIYAIPYTSIIEQNAAVFKRIFGEEVVLEHHSNIDPERETTTNRLQSENWNAPIVVTTNVQFFESLFAHTSSATRKLHNIADSIIILDEAQMVPTSLLEPILRILQSLQNDYGCTVVLCTATQPILTKRSFLPAGLKDVREIIPDPIELAQSLKRVRTHYIDAPLSYEEITQHLLNQRQVLCIFNKKKDAYRLYGSLSQSAAESTFHLSTNMCPRHRSHMLSLIHARLKQGEECRVVSTQLIEAGVDIDFPVVYRAIAGLDSLAQAAGRCNREGTLSAGDLYVFTPEEKLHPGQLKRSAESGENTLISSNGDFLSLEAIEHYFTDFYHKESRLQSKDGIGFDRKGIMQHTGREEGKYFFQSMSKAFRFIESEAVSVIISWKRDWVAELRQYTWAGFLPEQIRRQVQQYTVNLYQNQFASLCEMAHIIDLFEDGQYLLLDNDEISQRAYDENIGIVTEKGRFDDIDTLIV